MMEDKNKKEAIAKLISEGVLISPDLLEELEKIEQLPRFSDVVVINKDILQADIVINLKELEKIKARAEKSKDQTTYNAFRSHITNEKKETKSNTKVVFSYEKPSTKRSPKDFVAYFSRR